MSLCARCQTPRLSECCRYVELPLRRRLTLDEIHWVELHPGLRIEQNPDGAMVHIDIACSALTFDGKCGAYGTSARPTLCEVWPDDPQHQAPAGCAYLGQLVESR